MIYTSFFSNAGNIPNTLRKLSIASSKKISLDGRIDALAPSWSLVQGYKNGTISQEEYTVQYNKQLEKLDPAIVPDNSVLFCYEKEGDFCHRHLVAAWLRKRGISCEEWKGDQTMIGFRGDRFYLSNFYPYPMIVNGLRFECVEAAFQSFKTTDPEVRKQFVGLDGKAAKKLGRQIKLREDWELVKVKVMRQLIQAKFSKALGDKLKNETGNLVEYNTWGDKFWGVSSGQGKNMLGKILMEVRAQKKVEDIFNTGCDLLVDPVNCLGQSGKGLALQFKQKYPEQEKAFIAHAKSDMKPGTIFVKDHIAYFSTKNDWRNKSELQWIDSGLKELREYCDEHDHPSIAIPALGCGLGGLRHEDVLTLINKYFLSYEGMVKILF